MRRHKITDDGLLEGVERVIIENGTTGSIDEHHVLRAECKTCDATVVVDGATLTISGGLTGPRSATAAEQRSRTAVVSGGSVMCSFIRIEGGVASSAPRGRGYEYVAMVPNVRHIQVGKLSKMVVRFPTTTMYKWYSFAAHATGTLEIAPPAPMCAAKIQLSAIGQATVTLDATLDTLELELQVANQGLCNVRGTLQATSSTIHADGQGTVKLSSRGRIVVLKCRGNNRAAVEIGPELLIDLGDVSAANQASIKSRAICDRLELSATEQSVLVGGHACVSLKTARGTYDESILSATHQAGCTLKSYGSSEGRCTVADRLAERNALAGRYPIADRVATRDGLAASYPGEVDVLVPRPEVIVVPDDAPAAAPAAVAAAPLVEEATGGPECSVCMINKPNAIMDCCHICVCMVCAPELRQCPVCREAWRSRPRRAVFG